MKKRSAIVAALGLVAALVIGGVGFTMGITGPAPSLASVRQPAPKVRTIHRTVTVHRPAAATAVSGTVAPSGAGMNDTSGVAWDDDGWEDEGEGEGEGEGDQHEDADHEGEDHAEGEDD
jgi:hypothetical protein